MLVTIDQAPMTWRSLQLRIAPTLVDALNQSLTARLAEILASLEGHLSDAIADKQNAQEFLRMLPVVRGKCNEDIYELPMAAQAYAYTHLAERYLRWWRVFHHLFNGGWFPMRAAGIKALDAGSGPAPATYALLDFVHSLQSAALSHKTDAETERMQTNLPRVELSERSIAMGRLVHQVSERRELGGPYHITFPDAFDIELEPDKATNAVTREALLRKIEEEWDVGRDGARYILNSEYPDWHKPERFHLCMFSYLLTTDSMVRGAKATMRHIRRTLPPGGLVVVMGGGGEDYAGITLRLRRHMRSLHRLALSGSFRVSHGETTRQVVKQFHVRVAERVRALAVQPEDEDAGWLNSEAVQTMWDLDRLARPHKNIGIEVYRASDSRGVRRRRTAIP